MNIIVDFIGAHQKAIGNPEKKSEYPWKELEMLQKLVNLKKNFHGMKSGRRAG